MTVAEQLFDKLRSRFRADVPEFTNDRAFAGQISLRVESEDGCEYVIVARCQHDCGLSFEESHQQLNQREDLLKAGSNDVRIKAGR